MDEGDQSIKYMLTQEPSCVIFVSRENGLPRNVKAGSHS